MGSAQSFATMLETLLDMPLQSQEDVSQWFTKAQEFQRLLKGQYAEVPQEVWHFLADADIRSQPSEQAYRQRQEAAVRAFLAQLQNNAQTF